MRERIGFDAATLAGRLLDEAIGHAYRWVLNVGASDYPAHLEDWAQRITAELSP